MWASLAVLAVLLAGLRVYLCLPTQRRAVPKKSPNETVRTVVIWGSGEPMQPHSRLNQWVCARGLKAVVYVVIYVTVTRVVGGHTTEMCRLLRGLSPKRYSPLFFVCAPP